MRIKLLKLYRKQIKDADYKFAFRISFYNKYKCKILNKLSIQRLLFSMLLLVFSIILFFNVINVYFGGLCQFFALIFLVIISWYFQYLIEKDFINTHNKGNIKLIEFQKILLKGDER